MALSVSNNGFEAFAQLLTLFLIFIFVLGLTYFATKWVGNIQKNRLSGSNVKVLETMRITNSKYIQVIKIGSKCFAIAVCKDTVTYLCELNEDDLTFQDTSVQLKSESFKNILDKFKKDKLED